MLINLLRTIVIVLVLAFPGIRLPATVQPQEIKIWTARALATVLAEVGSQFERANNCKLTISSDLPPAFQRRADAGEKFDLLISTSTFVDDRIKAGKILPATRTEIARSGIGMEVKAGGRKPDIRSLEQFKSALLNARSIAYLKDIGSGIHISRVIENLGLTEQLKSKTTRPDSDIVSELVANGKVELGMVVITQILTTPGVQLVGPLPAEIQSYVTFTAGVSVDSNQAGAARDLIQFLTGSIAIPVIKSQGMEPLGKSVK